MGIYMFVSTIGERTKVISIYLLIIEGENQVNLARIISNAVSKEHGPKIWCQV